MRGDPEDDFYERDFEQYQWLKTRPTCDECLEPIQDEYYYKIGGRKYCEACIMSSRKYIDD